MQLGSRTFLEREGKKITQRDMELLLTKTGTDMGNLRMELEKLITYTGDRECSHKPADIQEVCTTQTQNKIFDMVRAVTGEKPEACPGSVLRSSDFERAADANPVTAGKAVSAAACW